MENIRISAKKRYSNGCTLLAVGITFAVIFGLGGIGCIVASDALLPDLITETMIGDTVATAAEGMTYTFTTGASMATTVLEITGNVLTLVACGFGAMIAAGASRLSASKKLRLLADAAEGEDYVRRVAAHVDSQMREVLSQGRLSQADGAVLASMNIADQYFKEQEAAENLRRQIKEYLEEATKLKMELSEAKRESFKLQNHK